MPTKKHTANVADFGELASQDPGEGLREVSEAPVHATFRIPIHEIQQRESYGKIYFEKGDLRDRDILDDEMVFTFALWRTEASKFAPALTSLTHVPITGASVKKIFSNQRRKSRKLSPQELSVQQIRQIYWHNTHLLGPSHENTKVREEGAHHGEINQKGGLRTYVVHGRADGHSNQEIKQGQRIKVDIPTKQQMKEHANYGRPTSKATLEYSGGEAYNAVRMAKEAVNHVLSSNAAWDEHLTTEGTGLDYSANFVNSLGNSVLNSFFMIAHRLQTIGVIKPIQVGRLDNDEVANVNDDLVELDALRVLSQYLNFTEHDAAHNDDDGFQERRANRDNNKPVALTKSQEKKGGEVKRDCLAAALFPENLRVESLGFGWDPVTRQNTNIDETTRTLIDLHRIDAQLLNHQIQTLDRLLATMTDMVNDGIRHDVGVCLRTGGGKNGSRFGFLHSN